MTTKTTSARGKTQAKSNSNSSMMMMTTETGEPQVWLTKCYEEIDQIYDYIRGLAPLPVHLRNIKCIDIELLEAREAKLKRQKQQHLLSLAAPVLGDHQRRATGVNLKQRQELLARQNSTYRAVGVRQRDGSSADSPPTPVVVDNHLRLSAMTTTTTTGSLSRRRDDHLSRSNHRALLAHTGSSGVQGPLPIKVVTPIAKATTMVAGAKQQAVAEKVELLSPSHDSHLFRLPRAHSTSYLLLRSGAGAREAQKTSTGGAEVVMSQPQQQVLVVSPGEKRQVRASAAKMMMMMTTSTATKTLPALRLPRSSQQQVAATESSTFSARNHLQRMRQQFLQVGVGGGDGGDNRSPQPQVEVPSETGGTGRRRGGLASAERQTRPEDENPIVSFVDDALSSQSSSSSSSTTDDDSSSSSEADRLSPTGGCKTSKSSQSRSQQLKSRVSGNDKWTEKSHSDYENETVSSGESESEGTSGSSSSTSDCESAKSSGSSETSDDDDDDHLLSRHRQQPPVAESSGRHRRRDQSSSGAGTGGSTTRESRSSASVSPPPQLPLSSSSSSSCENDLKPQVFVDSRQVKSEQDADKEHIYEQIPAHKNLMKPTTLSSSSSQAATGGQIIPPDSSTPGKQQQVVPPHVSRSLNAHSLSRLETRLRLLQPPAPTHHNNHRLQVVGGDSRPGGVATGGGGGLVSPPLGIQLPPRNNHRLLDPRHRLSMNNLHLLPYLQQRNHHHLQQPPVAHRSLGRTLGVEVATGGGELARSNSSGGVNREAAATNSNSRAPKLSPAQVILQIQMQRAFGGSGSNNEGANRKRQQVKPPENSQFSSANRKNNKPQRSSARRLTAIGIESHLLLSSPEAATGGGASGNRLASSSSRGNSRPEATTGVGNSSDRCSRQQQQLHLGMFEDDERLTGAPLIDDEDIDDNARIADDDNHLLQQVNLGKTPATTKPVAVSRSTPTHQQAVAFMQTHNLRPPPPPAAKTGEVNKNHDHHLISFDLISSSSSSSSGESSDSPSNAQFIGNNLSESPKPFTRREIQAGETLADQKMMVKKPKRKKQTAKKSENSSRGLVVEDEKGRESDDRLGAQVVGKSDGDFEASRSFIRCYYGAKKGGDSQQVIGEREAAAKPESPTRQNPLRQKRRKLLNLIGLNHINSGEDASERKKSSSTTSAKMRATGVVSPRSLKQQQQQQQVVRHFEHPTVQVDKVPNHLRSNNSSNSNKLVSSSSSSSSSSSFLSRNNNKSPQTSATTTGRHERQHLATTLSSSQLTTNSTSSYEAAMKNSGELMGANEEQQASRRSQVATGGTSAKQQQQPPAAQDHKRSTGGGKTSTSSSLQHAMLKVPKLNKQSHLLNWPKVATRSPPVDATTSGHLHNHNHHRSPLVVLQTQHLLSSSPAVVHRRGTIVTSNLDNLDNLTKSLAPKKTQTTRATRNQLQQPASNHLDYHLLLLQNANNNNNNNNRQLHNKQVSSARNSAAPDAAIHLLGRQLAARTTCRTPPVAATATPTRTTGGRNKCSSSGGSGKSSSGLSPASALSSSALAHSATTTCCTSSGISSRLTAGTHLANSSSSNSDSARVKSLSEMHKSAKSRRSSSPTLHPRRRDLNHLHLSPTSTGAQAASTADFALMDDWADERLAAASSPQSPDSKDDNRSTTTFDLVDERRDHLGLTSNHLRLFDERFSSKFGEQQLASSSDSLLESIEFHSASNRSPKRQVAATSRPKIVR